MQLNFKHLKYFWTVAHEGSLTRASEVLHISTPALSVQIQKLEEQLGHTLFDRKGRQLVLNEAGRVALDYADTIFTAGADLLGSMRGIDARASKVIRIGAMATLSRNFQVSFLSPLLTRDDLDIVVRSDGFSVLLKELEDLQLDVLLVNTPPAVSHDIPWLTHLIAEQPVSIVGSPSRVSADADIKELLSTQPLILPSEASSIRNNFDAWLDRSGIQPKIVAEVDDMAMIRLLARADHGIAVVPPIVVRDELDSGLLVEAKHFDVLTESFYAITLKRRFDNPLVRELLDDHYQRSANP
ncbi:LysR family transcriptional regulator [Congregibacter variabilis]|uniref:LysR family transcriptional regulator n=1 Tax=Congregibacter variabilis TaxID=3081200 RepID=A0ABZ0I4Q5_9GAMM|nr:LysR family transcriptional regulator [Congregibacter sp. IMCC43200]